MKFNKIFDAFPTPQILDIRYAGLSISDSAVRCIQFVKKDGKLCIQKYTEKILPQGLVVSGQITDKNEIVKVLSEIKRELGVNWVRMSLPEEQAYLFTAKIPIVKPSEVQSAIESKIEENVPVNPAELLYDYELIDHRERGHLDVVVSNVPINVIETYIDLVSSAGLSLLSLEIESQAVVRALIPKDDQGTELIVHFGLEKVGLYVANTRIVRFTSTLPMRGKPKENLDFVAQEIKKLFIYWHTLKENKDRPEKKINQIIISGENVSSDFADFLSKESSTQAVLGNVWVNTFDIHDSVPEISFDESLKFAVAVGLALPSRFLI